MSKGAAKPAKGGVRLVVVLSDVHAGSTVSIAPERFVTLEGQTVEHNAIQAWLWQAWKSCLERLDEYTAGEPFALVLLGDLVEGCHHHTKQVISPDVADHVEAAKQLLEPLAKKAAKVFAVRGTEIHVGSSECALAKALGAVPDPNTKKAVWDRLTLDVCGVRMVAQHHIGASARHWTKATALGIALANEQAEAASAGETVPRVLASAHRHVYGEYRDGKGMCFVTPAWQALTNHGHKVAGSSRVNVGMVVADWRRRKNGELPDLEPILCKAPEAKGAEI